MALEDRVGLGEVPPWGELEHRGGAHGIDLAIARGERVAREDVDRLPPEGLVEEAQGGAHLEAMA
jgi:hypothetical protein